MKSKNNRERERSKKYGSLIRAVVLAAIAALVYVIGRKAGIFQEMPMLQREVSVSAFIIRWSLFVLTILEMRQPLFLYSSSSRRSSSTAK